LPASHVGLLDRPLPAALTAEMPDGRLQSTVVWYEREGDDLLINTMREFQKAGNLLARPRCTALIIEPGDPGRWVEVRTCAVRDTRDPLSHLDALARPLHRVPPVLSGPKGACHRSSRSPAQGRATPVAASSAGRGVQGQIASATTTPMNAAPTPETMLATALARAWNPARSSISRTVSNPNVE
jgi:hypothetical protein